jgi:ABC-2 type transport system permease protein
MIKILTIAWREFAATVLTKGFILGMLLPPIIGGLALTLFPLLMNQKPPAVSGHIAVIDRSGGVAHRLETAFSKEKMAERRQSKFAAGAVKAGIDPALAKEAANRAPGPSAMLPELPTLSVVTLPADSDVEGAKQEILRVTGKEDQADPNRRLALIVVPESAVIGKVDGSGTSAAGTDADAVAFESYQMFVAPRLDIEVQGDIQDEASRAVVDARLEAAKLPVAQVRAMIQRPQVAKQAVTAEGDRKTSEIASVLLPAAFMFLMWISVFTSGQYLLTSTIEEKSNRVMEVLLSAVSPLQLMVGKILGKGAVGLLVLLLYAGAGILVLAAFAMKHLVPWQSFVYLFVYFFIAYFIIACLFASIGAAVTELAEAQALMGPVMLVLVIPMVLWMPILRNPNSTFAQVCSFVPLINPFVMILRISGSEPIPFWQIPASILVGLLTVVVMVWLAAKIFRIGVLMYGKPPNVATLLRWVRMA